LAGGKSAHKSAISSQHFPPLVIESANKHLTTARTTLLTKGKA